MFNFYYIGNYYVLKFWEGLKNDFLLIIFVNVIFYNIISLEI